MRKLVLLLVAVVAGACRTAPEPTPTPGARFGAEAPRAAVEAFLGAIRAEDLQAISLVWGNERGPLVNDGSVTREEIEQRELLMICFFRHDQAQVLSQVQTGEPSHTVFRVELKRQNQTRTPTMSTVQGPAGRWYVVDADISSVRDWCAQGGAR